MFSRWYDLVKRCSPLAPVHALFNLSPQPCSTSPYRERERMHEELRNNLWVHRLCGSDNIYKCFMPSKFIYHLIIPLRIIESPLYFSFATKFLFMMWFRSKHRSRLTKRFTTLILFSADLSPQLYDPCSSSTFSWQFFSVNW